MRRLGIAIAASAALAAAWTTTRSAAAPAPADSGAEVATAPPIAATSAGAADGAALYNRYCLACHGTRGNGGGPAAPWLWPQPRDLTRGEFKWRSTPSGTPPTDHDLRTAIRYGVPGTSMHPFGATLGDADIDALVATVRGFSQSGDANTDSDASAPAELVAAGAALSPPEVTPLLITRGKQVYLELGCGECHGQTGKGDGPSAAALVDDNGLSTAPYDLTARPVRRPREPGESRVVAVYKSLITGLDGTPMPSYQGAAATEDLWAVAAWVDSIAWTAGPDAPALPNPTAMDDRVIALAKKRKMRMAVWPGDPTSPEALVWGSPVIGLQGTPPASLGPAQASLSPSQCGRCHAKQLREWRTAEHSTTTSAGVLAQTVQKGDAFDESCWRCHAPLAEQHETIRPLHIGKSPGSRDYKQNPLYDEALRDEGIACAACHVRQWHRLGPPRADNSTLLTQPGYPFTPMAIYERSDFCLACHQQPPNGLKTNNKPLLNTYREWLEGPYMRRGIQCQHCHMPNREHTWKGVHDPETFRQAYTLEAIAGRGASGAVSVRVRLTNSGAGHYLPTTPTPAAFLEVDLVDAKGNAIDGASASQRIGRNIEYQGRKKGWVEHEDTRIPPGENIEIAKAWKGGRTGDATHARITVRVEPDEFYEREFRNRLARKLTPEGRKYAEVAHEEKLASPYVAETRLVPIR